MDNNLTVEHGQEQAGNNAVKQVHDDPVSVNDSNPAALRRRLIEDVFG